jgi:hypothetical protein
MSETPKSKCCQTVYPKEWHSSFHGYRCHHNATVTRNGKPYCKQHDPVEAKIRDEAQRARWRFESEQYAINIAKEQIAAAHSRHCVAVYDGLVSTLRRARDTIAAHMHGLPSNVLNEIDAELKKVEESK